MNDNISAMIRMALDITVLAMLITVVVNLLTTTNNILGSAMMQLEAGTTAISLKPYEKYDGKIITGTQLRNAIAELSSNKKAIIVRNRANINNTTDAGTPAPNAQPVYGKNNIYAFNYGELLEPDAPGMVDSNGYPTNDLGLDASTNLGYHLFYMTKALGRKEGERFYQANLQVNNFNETVGSGERDGLTRLGGPEWIADNALYKCDWIVDINGTFIGIRAEYQR